jgi:hypothetical protein
MTVAGNIGFPVKRAGVRAINMPAEILRIQRRRSSTAGE